MEYCPKNFPLPSNYQIYAWVQDHEKIQIHDYLSIFLSLYGLSSTNDSLLPSIYLPLFTSIINLFSIHLSIDLNFESYCLVIKVTSIYASNFILIARIQDFSETKNYLILENVSCQLFTISLAASEKAFSQIFFCDWMG